MKNFLKVAMLAGVLVTSSNQASAQSNTRGQWEYGVQSWSVTAQNGFYRGFSLPLARTTSLRLGGWYRIKRIEVQADGYCGDAAYDLIVNGKTEADGIGVTARSQSNQFYVDQVANSIEFTAVSPKMLTHGCGQGTLQVRNVTVWATRVDEPRNGHVYKPRSCTTCEPRRSNVFYSREAEAVYNIYVKLDQLEKYADNQEEADYVDPAFKAAMHAYSVLQNRSPAHPASIEALNQLRDALNEVKCLLERQAEVDNLRQLALEFETLLEQIEKFRN